MRTVTLYGKPGCHLCDEAREAVARVRRRRDFELVEVDITLDPVLHRRYGERIPVIEVNGQQLFEFLVDEEALADHLE